MASSLSKYPIKMGVSAHQRGGAVVTPRCAARSGRAAGVSRLLQARRCSVAVLRTKCNAGSTNGVNGIEVKDGEDMAELSWVEEQAECRPRAYLIFNPVSGQGDLFTCLGTISTCLLPTMDLTILQTTPSSSAAYLTKKALAEGADIIIASGGDGTISEVAGCLIGTGKPLGIVPRGTANAFSTALNIPTHLSSLDYITEACKIITDGQQRVVDSAWARGEWGEWPLTLLLGIGLEAEMVDTADRDMKNQLGVLAYWYAGFKSLSRENALFDMTATVGDATRNLKTMAVTVANVAPPTSVLSQGLGQVIPDDGLLEMMAFVEADPNQTAQNIFSLAVKQILQGSPEGCLANEVVGLRAEKIKIETDPPQKVVVDGEILGYTPVEVEVVPASLVVLAPIPDEDEAKLRAMDTLRMELDRLKVAAEYEEPTNVEKQRTKFIEKFLQEAEEEMKELQFMSEDGM